MRRIKAKYDRPEPGEWITPIRRGYRLACCDCGLVHIMDHRLRKLGKLRYIQMRFFRANRATAMIRRHMKAVPIK